MPWPGQSTHHQQVVEKEHLPLMRGLFLQLVHICHLEETAAADQAPVGHGQHLEQGRGH